MSSVLATISAYLLVLLGGSPQFSQGITNLADIACGEQGLKPNPKLKASRIGSGIEAFRGEFPWMVSLQVFDGLEHFHLCGGFLINNRYVLSAAHCFQRYSKDRMTVLVGEHEIGVSEEPINAFGVGIEEIITHSEFQEGAKLRHDIALLRLKKEVEWNPYVQPACLPSSEEKIQNGQLTSVAGWGYTNETPEVSRILMTVDIPVISSSVCQDQYEQWRPTASQLCAGGVGSGKGACKGDSGGPLMMKFKTEERLSVIGILAAGDGCGAQMSPGIYTRVSSYVDWIKSHMRR